MCSRTVSWSCGIGDQQLWKFGLDGDLTKCYGKVTIENIQKGITMVSPDPLEPNPAYVRTELLNPTCEEAVQNNVKYGGEKMPAGKGCCCVVSWRIQWKPTARGNRCEMHVVVAFTPNNEMMPSYNKIIAVRTFPCDQFDWVKMHLAMDKTCIIKSSFNMRYSRPRLHTLFAVLWFMVHNWGAVSGSTFSCEDGWTSRVVWFAEITDPRASCLCMWATFRWHIGGTQNFVVELNYNLKTWVIWFSCRV